MNDQILKLFIKFLEDSKAGYEAKGYIPTLDLAIEDLKNVVENQNTKGE